MDDLDVEPSILDKQKAHKDRDWIQHNSNGPKTYERTVGSDEVQLSLGRMFGLRFCSYPGRRETFLYLAWLENTYICISF